MKRMLATLGVSAIALGSMFHGAEAKMIFYQINGQRYSYENKDPQQVAAARKRIEAANAADAAKAKADAERAKNPFATVFGSQAQRDADQAKAQLEQLLSEQEQGVAAEKRQRTSQTQMDDRRRKQAEEQTSRPAAADVKETAREQQSSASPGEGAPMLEPRVAAESLGSQDTPKTMLKTVVFDVVSGIKTTIMIDGSIHEELIDNSVLSKLAPEHGDMGSLAGFVNHLRKSSGEETTGSISP
jgi:FtsZ-interacting cell division protein ZipA